MSKQPVTKRLDQNKQELDLVASGASGQWSVFVTETHSGTEKWFAQIKGPLIYLSFEIPAAKMVEALLEFLSYAPVSPSTNSREGTRPLTIGKGRRAPIKFLRDSEYSDRYFLVLETAGHAVVRYSLEGKDLGNLVSALGQTRDELRREGLLS